MRILHLIPSMLGGGAERQLCYLAAGLVERGHEVTIGTMYSGPNTARLERTGARISWLRPRHALDGRAVVDLVSLIRSCRAEIVQTWLARMDFWGGLAAQLAARPWLYSERNSPLKALALPFEWRRTHIQAHLLRRQIRSIAAAIATNSRAAMEWWRAQIARPIPIRAIPNALPLEEIDSVAPLGRTSLGVPNSCELVLFAGRFEPQKNIRALVDVAKQLFTRRPQAVLIAAGAGPILDWFHRVMTDEISLGRCFVLGYRADIWSIMKAVDVVLSPSLFEGHPNVVLEAMACRAPIALSDIREHRDISSPAPEWLFPLDAPATAVDRICDILDQRTRREREVARARAVAERLSVSAMTDAYEALYREIT